MLHVCVLQAVSSGRKPQGSKLVKIGTINARHPNVLGVQGIGLQSLADALLRLVVLRQTVRRVVLKCSSSVDIMAWRHEQFAKVAALDFVNALVAVCVVPESHCGTFTEACVPINARLEHPAHSPAAMHLSTACKPARF